MVELLEVESQVNRQDSHQEVVIDFLVGEEDVLFLLGAAEYINEVLERLHSSSPKVGAWISALEANALPLLRRTVIPIQGFLESQAVKLFQQCIVLRNTTVEGNVILRLGCFEGRHLGLGQVIARET